MEYTQVLSGMTVHYLDTAPGDQGGNQVLLLFHGWGASKESFTPIVEALGARYRVIAPDLPGLGKTGEQDKPWSVSDYADFIQAFVDMLELAPLGFYACGHSHGGRILIRWSARSPEGLRRLILVDSAGLKPVHGLQWYGKVYAYKAGKKLLRIPILGKLLAPWAAKLQEKAGSTDYQQASPLMRATMTRQLDEDLGYCLPLIRVPTLLFWGEQDRETPLALGRRMERDIPNAGLVLLSPAGHYSYLDQPEVFLRALEYFLEH